MLPLVCGRMIASFDSTLMGMENNTGIVVPPEVIEQLGAGKKPSVSVNVNGYIYRSTVAVLGGRHLISVSAAIRKETGLKADDPIHVELTVETAPRSVEMQADFAAALDSQPAARAFFDKLSNSLQRYHVGNIAEAKTAETRVRRIDKAVELFLSAKQR